MGDHRHRRHRRRARAGVPVHAVAGLRDAQQLPHPRVQAAEKVGASPVQVIGPDPPCKMASMRTFRLSAALALFAVALFAAPPTVQEAKKFLDDAEKKLFALGYEAGQASWIQSTYITDDTEAVAAKENERAIGESVRLAKAATRFDGLKLPADMARKMLLLKVGLTLAAPKDPAESAEVTRLAASLEDAYGKGKYCP